MSMTEKDYRAAPGMNVSLLVHGLKSMRHLRWEMDHPTEQTPAMRRGTMAHTFILEPDEFHKRYVIQPPFHLDAANCSGKGKKQVPSQSKLTTYYKERVAEFEAEHEGAEIITEADVEWCEAVRQSVLSEPPAEMWLDVCEREVVLFGEICGMKCKGRLDLLSRQHGAVVDLKFTTDVRPRLFGNQAAKLHMPIRLAFYRELARQNGVSAKSFYLIAVEQAGPYDCVVFDVPDIVLDNAWEQIERTIKQVQECEKTGVWPGVSGGDYVEFFIPTWAMPEDEVLEFGL